MAALLCWQHGKLRRMHRSFIQDSLTGALTNEEFLRRLRRWMQEHPGGGPGQGAVLLVNMDRYTEYSSLLRLEQAGELLRQIADRLALQAQATPGGMVGRCSQDEFLVFLPLTGGDWVYDRVAQLHESLGCPYLLSGQRLLVTFGVSMALFPEHGRTAEALLRNLYVTMRHLKSQGSNRWQLFEPEMLVHQGEQQSLEQALRQAVADEAYSQFSLDYQPICETRSGRVIGCEALLRWRHPERGPVSPGEFIGLAESTGLIIPLGYWVLEQACQRAAHWPVPWRVHVNLSVCQMQNDELPERVAAILTRTGLAPWRLVLEVTESLLIAHYDRHARMLETLRARGVSIALDDFGTGYSSLTHLRKLPFDWLKLDLMFIAELESDGNSREVVAALLSMCHALGLSVVAEGVETDAQRRILESQGCEAMQGYLLGRPMSGAHIDAMAQRALAMP
ncbi:GGDEF domain-containing phosphodiesterase [Orrella sp. JC864]|uniref:putative bifunctional diguanylate cyclase/phosphodiesterase n=1 Tax=Orrella sp. JC864 TaxID=3120298 RepID=UPI00300BF146